MGIHVQTDYYEHLCVCVFGTLYVLYFILFTRNFFFKEILVASSLSLQKEYVFVVVNSLYGVLFFELKMKAC